MYPFHWIADPWNFIYIRALSARQIDLRSFTKTWIIYQLWWLHTQSYLEKCPRNAPGSERFGFGNQPMFETQRSQERRPIMPQKFRSLLSTMHIHISYVLRRLMSLHVQHFNRRQFLSLYELRGLRGLSVN